MREIGGKRTESLDGERHGVPKLWLRSLPYCALLSLALGCGPKTAAKHKDQPTPPPKSGLPVFPANDPSAWTCGEEQLTQAKIDAWCEALPDLGQPASLPPPADIDDLEAKNAYDLALRGFLHD